MNTGDKEVQRQLMQTIVDNEKEWRIYMFTQVTEINDHLKTLNNRTGKLETAQKTQCELCEERHSDANRPPTMTRIILTLVPIMLGLNVGLLYLVTHFATSIITP